MRGCIARALVRSVARCWWEAIVNHQLLFFHKEEYWVAKAKRSDWKRRLALEIHRGAALEAMTEEGLWG